MMTHLARCLIKVGTLRDGWLAAWRRRPFARVSTALFEARHLFVGQWRIVRSKRLDVDGTHMHTHNINTQAVFPSHWFTYFRRQISQFKVVLSVSVSKQTEACQQCDQHTGVDNHDTTQHMPIPAPALSLNTNINLLCARQANFKFQQVQQHFLQLSQQLSRHFWK